MDSHNTKPKQVKKSNPKKLKNTSPIKNVSVRYPWLWFVGLLAIPIVIGIFGYYQLIHVDYFSKIEPEKPIEIVSKQDNTISPNINNPTPLWSMLTITLSCASASWIIYRIIKFTERI